MLKLTTCFHQASLRSLISRMMEIGSNTDRLNAPPNINMQARYTEESIDCWLPSGNLECKIVEDERGSQHGINHDPIGSSQVYIRPLVHIDKTPIPVQLSKITYIMLRSALRIRLRIKFIENLLLGFSQLVMLVINIRCSIATSLIEMLKACSMHLYWLFLYRYILYIFNITRSLPKSSKKKQAAARSLFVWCGSRT